MLYKHALETFHNDRTDISARSVDVDPRAMMLQQLQELTTGRATCPPRVHERAPSPRRQRAR
eukprot:1651189-Amphidinium_carterae.1